MLERVSPTAECLAHIALRQHELPVRSSRYLGPSFWRHGRDHVETSAWWPSYLESIRRGSNVKSMPTKVAVAPKHRLVRTARITKFPATFLRNQTTSAQASAVDEAEVQNHEDKTNELENTEFRPFTSKEMSNKTSCATLWANFLKDGANEEQAVEVMLQLSRLDDRKSLDHALRAFGFVAKRNRTLPHYHTALDVAIRLDKYSLATGLVKEAVDRLHDQDIFVKFLAFCVSKNLWNTAADLWSAVSSRIRSPGRDAESKKQNFAGKHIDHFDSIPDLPSQLVTLAKRLASNDTVLIARKATLVDLCRSLCVLAVESDKVMRFITKEGVFSLISTAQQLGSEPCLHSAALATIGRSPGRGTKYQLAIVLYNDMKTKKLFIPGWVIGTMIGICSTAMQPPRVYRTLIEDYKHRNGGRMDDIYRRVLNACATQGEADDVLAVFDELSKISKPKHGDDLNPLVRVYGVLGDWENAQAQFDQIQARYGFTPSVRNWNSLLLAFTRSNRPEQAHSKFKEMIQSGVEPDQYSWTMLVTVAAGRGDTRYAQNLAKQARAAGISPPVAMIGAIVESCLLNNTPEEAWEIVIEATKLSRDTNESPVRLWNSLLRHYAFKSDSGAVLQIQERMKEFHVVPDNMTYAALMTVLVRQRKTQEAAQILRTLHFNQSLSANQFHYSILIHGFAMEHNMQQASKLYAEMLQRFPSATPSAKLSMLHLQAFSLEEQVKSEYLAGKTYRKPDLRLVLDQIETVLAETTSSDLTSAGPNPGFGRRASRNDIESVFFGSLITFLQRNQAFRSSAKVMGVLGEADNTLSWRSSLKRLSQKLEVSIAAQDWTAVSNAWNEIAKIPLQHCIALPDINVLPSKTHATFTTGREGHQFKDMIHRPLTEVPTPVHDKTILPAHRFVLSRPLSQYITALDKQSKHAEIIETVRFLLGQGYSLSSKNWNTLIQALCRSSDLNNRVLAFEFFERYLFPYAPSWDVIRRGRWILPGDEKPRPTVDFPFTRRDKRKSRKALEKDDPGSLMPTYFTMIHLASVWLKASRSSARGDHGARIRLERESPRTVQLVLQTSFLRDKVQAVLLRGQRVVGDPAKRPRRVESIALAAGIQGSQMAVDQIHAEIMRDLDANSVCLHTRSDAENLIEVFKTTETDLFPKKPLESRDKWHQRVIRAKQDKIGLLQQLIHKLKTGSAISFPLIGNMSQGQPSIGQVDIMSSKQATQSTVPLISPDRPASLRKLRRILRSTSQELLHDKVSLFPRPQKKAIRTIRLTQRQALRLYTIRGIAIPLRKLIHNRKDPHAKPKPRIDKKSAPLPMPSPQMDGRTRRFQGQALTNLGASLQRYRYKCQYLEAKVSVRGSSSQKLTKELKHFRMMYRKTSGRFVSLQRRLKRYRPGQYVFSQVST